MALSYKRSNKVAKFQRRATKKIRRVVFNIAEKKFITKAYSVVLADNSGAGPAGGPFVVSLMNRIVQGTTSDANTRIGNRINVRGIWIALELRPSGTMEQIGTLCRFLVIHNKVAQNVGLATWTQIFENTSMTSNRNRTTLPNYTVMKEGSHAMNATAVIDGTPDTTYSGGIVSLRWYMPIGKQFNYITSTFGSGTTAYGGGNIDNVDRYIAPAANNVANDDYQFMIGASAASCCGISLNWQVLFTDM